MVKRSRSRVSRRKNVRRYKRAARKTVRRATRSRVTRSLSVPHRFSRWIANFPSTVLTTGTGLITSGLYTASTSILSFPAAAGASELQFAVAFAINDVPNRTEFTALFDQYKIMMVRFQIKLINVPEVIDAPGSTTLVNYANFYPTIWYYQDKDDMSPVSLAQIKECGRVRHTVLRPNKELNIWCRPSPVLQVYESATTAGYATSKARWLDLAHPQIPHYGLKGVIDLEGLTNGSAVAAQGFQFKINAQYFLALKDVR